MLIRAQAGLLAAILSLGAAPASHAAELPASACPSSPYPSEALRYQYEGTVQLEFTSARDRHPVDIKLLSEGVHPALARATRVMLESCKVQYEFVGKQNTFTVHWKLPQEQLPEVAARLDPALCEPVSPALQLAASGAPGAPAADVIVRSLVWTNGQAYSARLERSSGDADVDQAALALAAQCKYIPALKAGRAVPGMVRLSYVWYREQTSPAAVQTLYDKLVALAGRQHEILASVITVPGRGEADRLLTQLRQGADFADLARKHSLGQAAKVGGAQGWLSLEELSLTVREAVGTPPQPGLVPTALFRGGSWHLLLIHEVRPRQAMPLDDVLRATLRKRLLQQRNPSDAPVTPAAEGGDEM